VFTHILEDHTASILIVDVDKAGWCGRICTRSRVI